MSTFNDNEPQNVMIGKNELICPVCGNKYFFQRFTKLNTGGMSFIGLDWANKSAKNYFCSECGYMYWFHPLD